VTAELSLWYDGMCIAPWRQSRSCDGRPFDLGLHPIFTPRWYAEREVEYGLWGAKIRIRRANTSFCSGNEFWTAARRLALYQRRIVFVSEVSKGVRLGQS
jgi:hypothetical protein